MKNIEMIHLIEFTWIWMEKLNFQLPRHHRAICRFLEHIWLNEKKGLLMAFRASGKSTLVGLFCVWLLRQNPNLRILIVAADHTLAKKMVQHIKRIIDQHPLCIDMKPEKPEEWASDCLSVRREATGRDPSVLARGLGSNLTGCRADVIICDDVEVPKTCDTGPKRQELRHKLDELEYVLAPNGMTLYIGTPHTQDTLYNTTDGFLKNWPMLRIPVLNHLGESNWPEKYPLEKVEQMKRQTGLIKFQSQMMLKAVQASEARLDVKRLIFYNDELSYHEANDSATLKIGNTQMVSVSCWWDPAFGSNGGDNSVIACVFSDANGHYYLHRLKYLKVPPQTEAAGFQCREVVKFIREYHLPAIHLETNGIGKFLPALLRQELNRAKLACSVIEKISRWHKQDRILAAFEVPLMNAALSVHNSVKQTSFLDELQDFDPFAPKGHDDALDAVAGCLLAEPIRLKRNTFNRLTYQKWQGGF